MMMDEEEEESSGWSKFVAKVGDVAASTSNSISAASSAVSTGIKSAIFAPETLESISSINDLMNAFFEDVPYNKVDIMLGLMLLNTYYRNIGVRSLVPLDDKTFLIEAERYMRFASATYGWKCVYGFHMTPTSNAISLLGAAVSLGDSANMKVLCEHTGLNAEDVVEATWTSTNFHPGHYIAIDHSGGAVILAIRGTFHARDCLVDLVAENRQYLDGMVHTGMYRCAEKKLKHLTPKILESLSKHPGYRFIVVGHSLGAGVASLFTLLFHALHPDIPIHCYAYAPPCTFSTELALSSVSKELITSFVLQDDIVPRLCYGTMEHLKAAVIHLLSQSSGTLHRTFQVMSAPGGVMPEALKTKLSSMLKYDPNVEVKYVSNTLNERAMFPPGRVFHLCRLTESTVDTYILEESNPALFNEIIVSTTMLSDHLPHSYETAFQECLKKCN